MRTPAPPPETLQPDDLELLLAVMPPAVRAAIERRDDRAELLEIVLDLGRLPEARFPGRSQDLGAEPVTREDLAYVVAGVGRFGGDNRAGIERTLHRISAIRNRVGDVVGLTCRVGRAVFGTLDILRDVIDRGASILLLGRPGVGKTTLLREAARVLADELSKRVVIVDTSNEIAGDGDIPHPGIGRARRMQVPSPDAQHGVMIEAVENHMPEVIVIDEIGTTAETAAARTIAERGVQLIATAHGNTLENLLQNPTLSDLVGGIQAVTLSDEEAKRRGTQKTVLERKAPPTFDVLIEILDRDRLAVHHRVADVVDRLLRGIPPRPELRTRREDGGVDIEAPDPMEELREARGRRGLAAVRSFGDRADRGDRGDRAAHGDRGGDRAGRGERPGESFAPAPPGDWRDAPRASAAGGGLAVDDEGEAPPRRRPTGRIVRVFPYGVSRGKIDRAIRDLGVPVQVVNHLGDADVVLTLKAQERRSGTKLRQAEGEGKRVEVLRANTFKQIEGFLRREFAIRDDRGEQELAMAEAEAACDEAVEEQHPVELPPRDRYLRRLQHELAERSGLASDSRGEEPYRRVVIYPR